MKVAEIIHNPFTNKDLGLCFRDNRDGEELPALQNETKVITLHSGREVLQVDFWTNEKFLPYINIWYGNVDENTDAHKRDKGWLPLMEIINYYTH